MADPEAPQKSPYVMQMEPGTYAWCSCGRSKNQPMCDGSHVGTEFTPEVTTIEEARSVAWCGCKRAGTAPFCDGSHTSL